ncbi:MAG: hypothetical protein HY289_02625 [Planctomycetes bacterium]|nr:hypothetical protein [Planctomycetota bacterium]
MWPFHRRKKPIVTRKRQDLFFKPWAESLEQRTLLSAGTLDPTFGIGGKVTTNISGFDFASAVKVDDSGRIVVAGYATVGSRDFAVARYLPNGTLDSSFDGDGIAVTAVSGVDDVINGMTIDGSGRILVVGRSSSGPGGTADFAVARYLPNGVLDTSFGGDGIVLTAISASQTDEAKDVVVDANGRIVVVGEVVSGNFDFAVVRYNDDGTLDTSFDGDGIVVTSFGSGDDGAQAVLMVGSRILVAGSATVAGGRDFAFVRYNADGSLDTTYDGDGKLTTPVGPDFDVAWKIAFDGAGRLVAGGQIFNGSNYDFAVVRYNPDGSLDPTFDGDGKAITPIGSGDDYGGWLVLDSLGRPIQGGYTWTGSQYDFALVRYNTDGSLDPSFGTNGKVVQPIGAGEDLLTAIALDHDGRIVVAGESDGDFAVARFDGGCAVPPPDIVSWWPGDGNANDIADGNNGTLMNGATFAAGKVGEAFQFDGVNDFVEVPDAANLTPAAAITLEAWVNPETLFPSSTASRCIISAYDSSLGPAGTGWFLGIWKGGVIRCVVFGPDGQHRTDNTDESVLTAGTWSHVAASFDVATQRIHIYVNGVEVPHTTEDDQPVAYINDSSTSVRIGAVIAGSGAVTGFWHGLIDEPSLYRRALSPGEIHDIFEAGSDGKCKNFDRTAPSTTASVSGPLGTNGWFVGPVIVTLSATDPDDAAVVTTYAIDGGAMHSYASPFVITGDGVHEVRYFSTDDAGNAEALQTLTIAIDSTGPNISATPSTTTLWAPNGKMVAIQVTGLITDSISGIDRTSATFTTIDSYGKVQPSGTIVVNADGSFSFKVSLEARRNGQDKAGRLYTIIISARNLAGELATMQFTILVPHDQGNG